MEIALLGASGFIGSRILKEALDRGHKLIAIVRNPEKILFEHRNLVVRKGDVRVENEVSVLVAGHDAVISAYNPGWKNTEIARETIVAYNAIIRGVKKAGIKRILVVGGAGSLEVAPGLQLVDTDAFPANFKAPVLAMREVFNMLRVEKNLDWTFLSPSLNITSGERTGKFRLGGDQLLRDANGESRISAEDYAVAMMDELENPMHICQRFTVGY